MMSPAVLLLLTLTLTLTQARPQYSYPSPSQPYPNQGYEQVSPQPGGPSGPLAVQCQRTEVAPGKYAFQCTGVNPGLITLRSQHVLWLQGANAHSQNIDVNIPNYRVDELIKAGFKPGLGGQTNVNILLQKPAQVYEAEVDVAVPSQGPPTVNLQYEPVGPETLVHFPNDKPYSPLSGPILPPPKQ